jgi:hypothetical protein
MANPGLPIRVLRVGLAALLVAAACWYSPLLTAAGWHLVHPRGRVVYRGLNVLVPWPWTADLESLRADPEVNPQGLSLKKTPLSLDRRLANQSIFITVISLDPGLTAEQQTAAWMQSFRATHPGANFEPAAPAQVPPGAGCLSARSHWNGGGWNGGALEEGGMVWTCISVQQGWVADFEGRSPDAPVFFDIVRNLKP